MTTRKFEKELMMVKEEIQSYHSEARKAEDDHTQSLTSIQAKLTTSQLVNHHEEGKVSRKLTQKIENLKRNLTETKEKLKCTEGDVTTFREEMKKSYEELKIVKQENSHQVAALDTKLKENLNHMRNFVLTVIIIFAVLAAWLSPYSTVDDVEKITAEFKTNCQNEMKNLSVDLMSNIDTINYDQGLQIQRFNDTLNAIQLQIVSESELVKLLHKNISAVNQIALTIINDVKIHCDHEMIKLTNIITKLSSKVDNVRND